jgi:uncharacterized iron-regulated membrane protein
MFETARQAMAWVHTGFGLVLGYVLMVVFFFGTLSVFDREIDRWAVPETRFAVQPMPSFDRVLAPMYQHLRPDSAELERIARRVTGELPDAASLPLVSLFAYTTHRDPVLLVGAEFGVPNAPLDPADDHLHVHGRAQVDPRSGAFLPENRLQIGTDFFYPMHYSLNASPAIIGYWVVGLAAMSMLAALVTGLVIHRRLLRELFTFRPHKRSQRSTLDLHNLTGVVALPFHFFFALTGLLIFAAIYLPVHDSLLRPLDRQHEVLEAAQTGLPHEPAGVAAPLASVDAMVAQAKARWAQRGIPGEVGFLTIEHMGDLNGYVSIFRAGSDRVALVGEGIHFSASTGEILYEDPAPSAVHAVSEFLTGLHLQHFRHWLLRWLYVLGGLVGCVCIATGFIFFTEKRKRQWAHHAPRSLRWVDALAVTAVTGMVLAVLGMLVANRVLPVDLPARAGWEERAFWCTWLCALLHAWVRSTALLRGAVSPAWREQCIGIAALAVLAVMLNWVTTGDHLWHTVTTGYWPVAGVDASLLAVAVIAFSAAVRLYSRGAEATSTAVETVEASRG